MYDRFVDDDDDKRHLITIPDLLMFVHQTAIQQKALNGDKNRHTVRPPMVATACSV